MKAASKYLHRTDDVLPCSTKFLRRMPSHLGYKYLDSSLSREFFKFLQLLFLRKKNWHSLKARARPEPRKEIVSKNSFQSKGDPSAAFVQNKIKYRMKKQPRVQLFLEQVFLRGSNLIVTDFRTAKIIKFWPWLDKCPLEAGFHLAKPGPLAKAEVRFWGP